VKRIGQEGPVVHVDDAAERAQRQVGRPSRVANFRKPILAILQQNPDLGSLETLRRARETGYEGARLYALVASLRPKLARPLVRFEGLPGNSVSTILDKSKWSSSMAAADAFMDRATHRKMHASGYPFDSANHNL
jgi:hypothetical protein